MSHWLGRGAGGWRLDAAYAVPPAFWAKAVPAVREAFPDAWFLGEMIHGDYAAYANEAGLDSITQYEVWKAIWSSLNDRNFYELDHALGRHNAFLDGELAQTFVGNHDVTRLATALNDDRHFGHALAVLCCIGGVPSVYYGDEQGFRGLKEHREGGDDAIRPAFPASPAELPPDGWRYYRLHQRLIGFRRRHPWLVRARTAAEHLEPSAMALRLRGERDGEQALLLLNVGDDRIPVRRRRGRPGGRGAVRAGRPWPGAAARCRAGGRARPAAQLDDPGLAAGQASWPSPAASAGRRSRGCRRSGSPGPGRGSRSWRRSG